MQCSTPEIASDHRAPSSGRFTWIGLGMMTVSVPLVGLTFARIGGVVQSYFAPQVIFPILLGVFVGLTVVALSRFTQTGYRPTIFLAAVASSIVAATGSDCGAAGGTGVSPVFRSGTGKMPVPPDGAGETPAPQVDPLFALLTVAAAVAVTIPAVRVPYCNRCMSWFRTIRNGKIDMAASRRLAELLGVEQPDRARSPRYRLSACRGDCGPTRCELSWERSGDGVDLARVWLDAGVLSEVLAILDELDANECETAAKGLGIGD